ncbi:hypothetical protein J2Y38_001863 [Flavobacterium sp. 2755]|uniref:hypothetical protein n=1 Tax=Flavobacterium sp. 2755 TaxID=2817765 RepID=UPI002860C942|nr:hypothetical protein [Flavobacterium sp. 2755]MDR6761654.1 hypothetical protein [Flavobacterium sp. 2755]
MNQTLLIIILSTIVLLIEIYSETHLKNYGTFLERTNYLFSIKTLFNILKFSSLFSFCYILLKLDRTILDSNLITTKIINIDFENILSYYIPSGIFSLCVIFSNSNELFRQFQGYSIRNEKLNQLAANLKYIVFRFISFTLTFCIFKYTLQNIIKLDLYFSKNNLSLFDWLEYSKNEIDNYNRGVYFSLLLTIIIFFLFNNCFIKKNSNYWNYRVLNFIFFKYFFISIILCLGLFFGIFSILNGVYNIFNSSLTQWISKENILGILPIRISSILIVTYLIGYIYKEVLHKNLINFLVLGIFPIRTLSKYPESIVFEKRETLFFSQISFYILNIALAELFIIIGYKNIYLSILNFAILFIFDDFKIINDYSRGLVSVLPSHFFRIWVFNIIMIIVAMILLANKEYYWILITYLLFTSILFRYYFKNFHLISLKSPFFYN